MVAMVMTEERLWTVEQVAEHLSVTPWTVRQWLGSGKLQGYRLGGRKAGWRIRQSALERFLAEREGQAGERSEG